MKKTNNKKVYLIYGSPLSGKTTYVKKHAQKGDLIIDIDNIWECLSRCKRYEKPRELSGVVLHIYNELIKIVKERKGIWGSAYVIFTEPSIKYIEQKAKELDATIIHIDTDKETCLDRLYKKGDGRNISTWKRYIEDYFRFADKGEIL